MICECHGHIILDGIAYSGAVAHHRDGADEVFIRKNLKACELNGITFYRDGGDKHMVSVFAKTIAGEYGIDYRTPAYIIHKRGFYGAMFGRAFDSMAEYRELVASAKRSGADFIKITASGILDFAHGGDLTGHPPAVEDIREMIKIAHGEGFAAMVHANGADNIKIALESGADSIEHGFYIDEPALKAMAQTGAVWVPTCATAANLIGTGKYDDAALVNILDSHKAAIKTAASMGVLIASGSDAGASKVMQGKGALDELDILKPLGIDPAPGNRRISEVFRRT